MEPDIEKYLPYVENLDLTKEEKIELIHMLWTIIESHADSAFDMNPVQQAIALADAEDARTKAQMLDFSEDFKTK